MESFSCARNKKQNFFVFISQKPTHISATTCTHAYIHISVGNWGVEQFVLQRKITMKWWLCYLQLPPSHASLHFLDHSSIRLFIFLLCSHSVENKQNSGVDFIFSSSEEEVNGSVGSGPLHVEFSMWSCSCHHDSCSVHHFTAWSEHEVDPAVLIILNTIRGLLEFHSRFKLFEIFRAWTRIWYFKIVTHRMRLEWDCRRTKI